MRRSLGAAEAFSRAPGPCYGARIARRPGLVKIAALVVAVAPLGLVEAAHASLADDLSTQPDRLVFDRLIEDAEAKLVKVTNNGSTTHELSFDTTGSSAFQVDEEAYCRLTPGSSCEVGVEYFRGTREEDHGTLVIKGAGPSADTTTETVALLGKTERGVPRCAVSFDRSQTLITADGRARAFRISVRQSMRGEIGLFTRLTHGAGGPLFGGERDFPARPGVTIKRAFSLTRTSRREVIGFIKSGGTPQYRLSVYCRAMPGRTRQLQYILTLRDDKVDRRFRGALVATAKFRASRIIG